MLDTIERDFFSLVARESPHIDETPEHLCTSEDPDRSLCGKDISDEPWNHGGPLCGACVAVAEGRMN